jgi:hypothetical protein
MPTNSAERRRYMFDHTMHALGKIPRTLFVIRLTKLAPSSVV